jgi:hypothetical protein
MSSKTLLAILGRSACKAVVAAEEVREVEDEVKALATLPSDARVMMAEEYFMVVDVDGRNDVNLGLLQKADDAKIDVKKQVVS